MVKRQFNKIKKWFVSVSGIWFYPANKLPVGTHLNFFLKYRTLIQLDVVFDVGANFGKFSKDLSYYYPKSKFFCFEPFPKTFEQLKSNLQGRDFNLYQLGIGDQSGLIFANQNDSNYSDTNTLIAKTIAKHPEKMVSIQVTTMDEFCDRQSINSIDLLKIDTEGYDLKVLKGSRRSLKKGIIKFVYVECGLDPSNDYHVFFPEILNYLNGFDYVFIGFFQTDVRKIDKKFHFSNALFVHQSFSSSIKTFH